MSSMFFDIAFATLSANMDEKFDNRVNDDDDDTIQMLPDKPSWWFYNFRIYTQLILLFFNVAKVISAASKHDTNGAILSVVRSICVLGIISRHYYLCNYKFIDLVHGKLTPHLIPLQVVFMSSYATVGAISAGIDPYFASDIRTVILFYLLPVSFRGLSFATNSLWSKMMTKTAADGTVVVPSIPALMVFNFYGAVFFFSVAGSNNNSKFFTDRLLCGLFFTIPFVSTARNYLKRETKREQLRLSQKASSSRLASSSGRGQIAPSGDEVQLEGVEDGEARFYGPTNDQERVNANDDPAVHDHKVNVLELRKHFTENKIFALITPVSCTFMIIMSFELAMSMYLYHRDGVPANWCEPFTFLDIDKGFQIILDYFL